MRDVAIVSFAQHSQRREDTRNEIEILLPVIRDALAPTGLKTQDMGFTVSGSTDYLAGQAFAFVSALDAVGPWPFGPLEVELASLQALERMLTASPTTAAGARVYPLTTGLGVSFGGV